MTAPHNGVIPYVPPLEISKTKLAKLREARSILQAYVLSPLAVEAERDAMWFRKILRCLIYECEIDVEYFAHVIGVRIETVKNWDTHGPFFQTARRYFLLDMGRILWLEIEAYDQGRISPQWLFQRKLNDNIPQIVNAF